MNKMKLMKIDEELSQLEYEFSKITNPYQEAASKALNLKINDFSVKDMKMAEKIMQEKKI